MTDNRTTELVSRREATTLLEEFLCGYQDILLSRGINASEAVCKQNELIDEYAERIEHVIATTLGNSRAKPPCGGGYCPLCGAIERTCKPTEEGCCPYCNEDLVRCDVGVGELGGAIELDPPIYYNYCPNCGCKVVDE